MKKIFVTSINCASCIRAVTPFLNEVEGVQSWEVDIADPKKKLTVFGDVKPSAVINAVKDAGYFIEEIPD